MNQTNKIYDTLLRLEGTLLQLRAKTNRNKQQRDLNKILNEQF